MDTVYQILKENIMMISFSDSTSLYFYSALLQGDAALITLVAMFLVYQKQHLDLLFYRLEDIIINHLRGATNVSVLYGSIFGFEKYHDGIFGNSTEENKLKLKKIMENSSWKERFEDLKSINDKRNMLWGNAVFPLMLVFIILGASVVALPLSDQIHNYPVLEVFLFIIYVSGEIYTLRLLFNFFKSQFI